jgi:hypothetical protein
MAKINLSTQFGSIFVLVFSPLKVCFELWLWFRIIGLILADIAFAQAVLGKISP